jgi:hypothetical protein
MHKYLLNAGIVPGHERFVFLYAVIAAGAIASAMTYSAIAGLAWWQSLLTLIACLTVGCAILFSILEVRRLAQTPNQRADEALVSTSNPYPSRIVVVEPPTGDPYPHHEDYAESAGLDQGQLTSKLPDSTPFIDSILSRGLNKKQKAGR